MPGYETWLAWAETDAIGAEGLLSLGVYSLVCDHASQAAEKYMTAVLEFVGHGPMKTHLLVRVDEELKKAGCDLGLSRESLTQLSRFSNIARYPSDEGSPEERFSREDTEKALAAMRHVRRCCRSALAGPSNGNGREPGHPPNP